MSKKRRSDTSQMRREDYEASLENGEDSPSAATGQGFMQRASAEQSKQRRIVKARRSFGQSSSSSSSGASNSTSSMAAQSSSPSPRAANPFAKINTSLIPGGAVNSKTFSFQPTAVIAGAKPTTTTAQTAGGVASGSFLAPKPTTAAAPKNPVVDEDQKRLCELLWEQDKAVLKGITEMDPHRSSQVRAMWRYSHYRVAVEHKLRKKEAEKENKNDKQDSKGAATVETVSQTATASAQKSTVKTATTATSASKPLSFGAATTTATATPFSFTSSISKSPTANTTGFPSLSTASQPTGAKGFVFPALGAAKAPVSSAPAAAAVAVAGGGFVFAPTSKSTTASVGGFPKPAASPSSAAEASKPDEEAPPADVGETENTKDDVVEEVEDPNWDDVQKFVPVKLFRRRDPKDSKSELVEFAFGPLRLQRQKVGSGDDDDKNNKKDHRLLVRNKSGTSVLLNVKVSSDTKFVYTSAVTPKTKKEVGQISFFAVNNPDRGHELLTMKANGALAKDLFAKLQAVASAS